MATTTPPSPTAGLHRKPLATLSRNPADPRLHIDWGLIVGTFVIAALGLVAIYTATYQNRTIAGLDTLYFVKRQGLAVAVGLVGMVAVMLIDYRKLRELGLRIYLATLALLAAVLIVAKARNGIDAWFNIGPFQLQPSEFAKVALVLVLAGYAANERSTGGPLPFQRFVVALAIVAVPTALVLVQPDLGTASALVVIAMAILLVAGAQWKHIALVTAMAILSGAVLIGTGQLARDQQDRLTAFLSQDATPRTPEQKRAQYQLANAKAAIADGGITGQGYLNGTYTNGAYVPEQHTDFVFSAVAEQFGLVGSVVLLAAYGFVILRMWRIARLAKDQLGALIATGALALLAWHVFENVGMNLGLMPVTGIPLPLISYGGSSVVAFLLLIGLVQSVHMRRFV
jgi:rod shape determining protein RodA